MSNFDPSAFMNAVYNDANSTEIIPCDEGEYQAIAGDLVWSTWQSRDGSKSGIKVTIPWTIDSEEQRQKTKRSSIVVKQDLMLDTTSDGMLDMSEGRNIGLGRLRDALGLNRKGVPFKFDQIPGKAAKVRVSRREYEGRLYEEIKAVAPL